MYRFFFKRLIDLVLAIIAFPFWLIILLIIGPLIYIQDRGMVFYNAPRLGKDGKIFKMYKFRSMKMNSPDLRNEDGSTYNSENDPRLTKIGKFIRKTSLDETPQLINVMKGEMSIIGPRPTISTKSFNQIKGIRRIRYDVRPGITGYTQAYFRNSITQEEKFEKDAAYVKDMSLKLDIKILLMTIRTVVLRKDIFVDDNSNSAGNYKKDV